MTNIAESPFLAHLRSLGDAPVYVDFLGGNHGDRLIRLGLQHCLKKSGIQIFENIHQCSYILLNGSGGFNKYWGATRTLDEYITNNPNTHIIVGPSTVDIPSQVLQRLIQRHNATITFFAREMVTFERLHALHSDAFQVIYSQDLAFELVGSETLKHWHSQLDTEHDLVSLRTDAETGFSRIARLIAYWQAKKRLPSIISQSLNPVKQKLITLAARRLIPPFLTEHATLPLIWRDVSRCETFGLFEHHVLKANLVITDRLHVGIFAGMLGKKVFLFTNAYFKNEAVYTNSPLRQWPNITLLPTEVTPRKQR